MGFEPRLYCETNIKEGEPISLNYSQAHYLFRVMRLKEKEEIFIFNGIEGEWKALIEKNYITPIKQIFPQPLGEKRLILCFTPIKIIFLRSIIRQATELGVDILQPIKTTFTNAFLPDLKKYKSWIIEAAEQSGRLTLPELNPLISFTDMVKQYSHKNLILCDRNLGQNIINLPKFDVVTMVIGPEGGFSKLECEVDCLKLNLGDFILRADTAVVTALAYARLLL